MFRALFRLILLLIVLVGVGGFLLGWWTFGDASRRTQETRDAVGTAGEVSTDKAREVGAQVGETAAVAANQAKNALANGAITAKIKSKMTLDDTLEAMRIDVDTSNGVVTLSGTVDTEAQRQRALQLARETDGVRQVEDRLKVRR
jgi:hyperosmotically inducible protein